MDGGALFNFVSLGGYRCGFANAVEKMAVVKEKCVHIFRKSTVHLMVFLSVGELIIALLLMVKSLALHIANDGRSTGN